MYNQYTPARSQPQNKALKLLHNCDLKGSQTDITFYSLQLDVVGKMNRLA